MNKVYIILLAIYFFIEFFVVAKQTKKIKELEDENLKLKQLLER